MWIQFYPDKAVKKQEGFKKNNKNQTLKKNKRNPQVTEHHISYFLFLLVHISH